MNLAEAQLRRPWRQEEAGGAPIATARQIHPDQQELAMDAGGTLFAMPCHLPSRKKRGSAYPVLNVLFCLHSWVFSAELLGNYHFCV